MNLRSEPNPIESDLIQLGARGTGWSGSPCWAERGHRRLTCGLDCGSHTNETATPTKVELGTEEQGR